MTPKTVAVGAVLLVLVLVSAAGKAQVTSWQTGNELKERCNSESAVNGGICLGFVMAIAGIVSEQPVSGWRACIPNGVTSGQLMDITTKYLDDHPANLHLSAASLAAEAIAIAFPCSK